MNTSLVSASRTRAAAQPQRPVDLVLLAVVVGLVVLGLMMAYSSTFVQIKPTDGQLGSEPFRRQVFWAGVGLVVMFAISRIDYGVLRRFALPVMAVTVILLILVLLTPKINGARRWLADGSFQPSELAKLAIVIYGAAWLASRRGQLGSLVTGLIPFSLITGLTAVLILVQPDFGTTSVVVASGFAMLFLAGASIKYFAAVAAAGVALYPLALEVFKHAAERVANFAASSDPNYWQKHVPQAKIAFALGSWFGTGLGTSYQKLTYLPLPHTDSILAVLGEELGLLGLLLTLALFALLAWRCLAIGRSADSHFGAYLAGGVMVWLVFQLCVNAMSLMEMIPFTGIPVPFLSVGGSSLVAVLAACGMVLSVSRGSRVLSQSEPVEGARGRGFARTSRGSEVESDALGRRDGGPRASRADNPGGAKTYCDAPVLVGRDIRPRRESTRQRAGSRDDRGVVRRGSGRYGGGPRSTG